MVTTVPRSKGGQNPPPCSRHVSPSFWPMQIKTAALVKHRTPYLLNVRRLRRRLPVMASAPQHAQRRTRVSRPPPPRKYAFLPPECCSAVSFAGPTSPARETVRSHARARTRL
jgi:hypothetical protein